MTCEDACEAAGGMPNLDFRTCAGDSLMEALSFKGGPGFLGAARILLREAVSDLLNAAHPDVDYIFTPQEVIEMVSAALGSGDRNECLEVQGQITQEENCPFDETFMITE